jgi:hypothetical protein
VLCILAFALYPQQALRHSEPDVKASMAPVVQAEGGAGAQAAASAEGTP